MGLDQDVEISEGREDVSLPPIFWDPTNSSEKSRAQPGDRCVSTCWFGLRRLNEETPNSAILIN